MQFKRPTQGEGTIGVPFQHLGEWVDQLTGEQLRLLSLQLPDLERLLQRVHAAQAEQNPLPVPDVSPKEIASHQLLREAVFAADSNGVAVLVGPELRFAYANPAYRYLTPDPALDPVGQPYHVVWPHKSKYSNRDRFREVLESGQPFQFIGIEYAFPDGTKRIFTLQARRMEWDLHQPAVLIILWDITEQKRVEAEMHSVALFPEQNPDPILRIDLDGKLLYANPVSQKLLPDFRIGQQVSPFWQQIIAEVQQANDTRTIDFEHQGRIYAFQALPIPDSGYVNLYGRDITERRQTAMALRASEARLKRAQEIAHLGSWELDLAANQLTWSDEVYRIFGLEPQEFGPTYPAFLEHVHPDDRAAVDEAYSGSIRDGRDTYEIEHRVVRKATGEVRFVHEKCEHIRDDSGQIIRSIGMVQDITERKRDQIALQESESKFLSIFQNSPFAIALSQPADGRIIEANQAALRVFDYERHEVLNRTSVELNVFPDIPTREALLAELDRQGNVRNHEIPYQTRTGKQLWLSLNLDRITIQDKPYMLNTIADITERKHVERALQTSEERYRRLFEGITEGFGLHEIICDSEGKPVDYRFLEVNSAFEQMTGLERGQILGRTVLEVMPETEAYWIETYGEVALTGQSVHFQNYSQELGKFFEVVAFCPEPGQFAVLFIDITERKRLEEEHRQKATEVELQHRLLGQREQERLQIARDLHDGPVQELLASIFALQNLRYRVEGQPELEADLTSIQQGLHQQVAELRTYAGELRPPALTKFGLERAMRSHLDTFQEKHPDLLVHFDAHQVGELLKEPVRLALYRIFQEALNNIIRHARASEVSVRFQKEAHLAVIEIQDNGVGFDPPTDWLGLARQGHLGLVGMRERAEAVGGRIEIRSEKGNGTLLRVSVPLDVSPS